MSEPSRISTGLRRGLGLRCPHCGEGRLFRRFLTVSACEACGSDNTRYPADDAPPYLTLFLVGHFVVPFVFWMDKAWSPALWVMFAIWLPLITAITLATLPFMKGAVVGIAWANGVTRETARQ
ncbi:DUF983 domain-containing protein [Pararoseomonas indoligenes]|uniref:DUF983 domain-containing protein n=1 Tax=Roseomonas indoligenes TaxID=2820811 RepID=A0A940N6Q6_9PROT|nr:DUF983 domain-containing protein [Pararoseomonas indoligenes]MBP0495127.1 DUF983 domain-containing protein [Pararoseomonas indoligenes]